MTLTVDTTGHIPGACGLTNIDMYAFKDDEDDGWHWGQDLEKASVKKLKDGGSTMAFMCFIDNKESKAAFDIATKRFKLLYQSPLKPNSIHKGRKFFVCLFEMSEAPVTTNTGKGN